MSFENNSFVAGGDIRPSRFVKLSTAADRTLLEADANEQTIGVSQDFTKAAPQAGASTLAAEATDPIGHHPIGSYCLVEAGDTITSAGLMLKSDGDGKAVVAATTGTTLQWVAAISTESAAAGELTRVLVVSMPYRPAIA